MELVLLDTNIVIDFLNGLEAAVIEIEKHDDIAISIISWMEVLVGVQKEAVEVIASTRTILCRFTIHTVEFGPIAEIDEFGNYTVLNIEP